MGEDGEASGSDISHFELTRNSTIFRNGEKLKKDGRVAESSNKGMLINDRLG